MEPFEIIQLLANAPMSLLLLYMLIQEQRAHAETRRLRDADNVRNAEKMAHMAERVIVAVERLDLPPTRGING